jgi:ribosome-binding protein aMBF1 (putative translation factor)
MQKPRVHRSKFVNQIKQTQDPLIAARNKKKLILAAMISDALEQKEWKKGTLANRLDVYASEVTRWTKGTHNFSVDILSDIEEILGINIFRSYKQFKTELQAKTNVHYTTTLPLDTAKIGTEVKISDGLKQSAKHYIANDQGGKILPFNTPNFAKVS